MPQCLTEGNKNSLGQMKLQHFWRPQVATGGNDSKLKGENQNLGKLTTKMNFSMDKWSKAIK